MDYILTHIRMLFSRIYISFSLANLLTVFQWFMKKKKEKGTIVRWMNVLCCVDISFLISTVSLVALHRDP